MNKSQVKDYRMMGTTSECLNVYRGKWAHIPVVVQLFDRLNGNIAQIVDLDRKKTSKVSNPVTKNKEKTKELLTDSIDVLAGIVSSYAEANNLKEVEQKVKLYTKGLVRKRETEVAAKAGNFLSLVRELMPGMAGYELTDGMVAEAEGLRDQFVALVGTPRNLIVEGSTASRQIDVLIAETNRFLTFQLDKLMLRFKNSAPEFFNSYLQARIVVEPATQHRENRDEEPPVV
jgi:hypothetical protein